MRKYERRTALSIQASPNDSHNRDIASSMKKALTFAIVGVNVLVTSCSPALRSEAPDKNIGVATTGSSDSWQAKSPDGSHLVKVYQESQESQATQRSNQKFAWIPRLDNSVRTLKKIVGRSEGKLDAVISTKRKRMDNSPETKGAAAEIMITDKATEKVEQNRNNATSSASGAFGADGNNEDNKDDENEEEAVAKKADTAAAEKTAATKAEEVTEKTEQIKLEIEKNADSQAKLARKKMEATAAIAVKAKKVKEIAEKQLDEIRAKVDAVTTALAMSRWEKSILSI